MVAVGIDKSSVIFVNTFQFICFQELGLFSPSSSWRHGSIFLQFYFSLRHPYDHSNLSFHSTLLLLNTELSRSTCVCQVMWLPHRELQLLPRLLVMSLLQPWLVWLHALLLCILLWDTCLSLESRRKSEKWRSRVLWYRFDLIFGYKILSPVNSACFKDTALKADSASAHGHSCPEVHAAVWFSYCSHLESSSS